MRLDFYTRPNCPLCDRLEEMLEPHLAAASGRRGEPVELIHHNILDDPAWHAAYRDRVPVAVLGDRVLLEGRPDDEEVARDGGNMKSDQRSGNRDQGRKPGKTRNSANGPLPMRGAAIVAFSFLSVLLP